MLNHGNKRKLDIYQDLRSTKTTELQASLDVKHYDNIACTSRLLSVADLIAYPRPIECHPSLGDLMMKNFGECNMTMLKGFIYVREYKSIRDKSNLLIVWLKNRGSVEPANMGQQNLVSYAYKARMNTMVDNLIAAYAESIKNLDWMSEETKQQSLVKLSKFTPKIGYPDKWKDYSVMEVVPDSYIKNVRSANAFEFDRDLVKIGKPVDKTEWGMTPQTVNAYYNPTNNEIVFPAAILQPPFFNLEADEAVNYGAIGAVIGHEIGHGFDDQGSTFDGDGVLRNW